MDKRIYWSSSLFGVGLLATAAACAFPIDDYAAQGIEGAYNCEAGLFVALVLVAAAIPTLCLAALGTTRLRAGRRTQGAVIAALLLLLVGVQAARWTQVLAEWQRNAAFCSFYGRGRQAQTDPFAVDGVVRRPGGVLPRRWM